MAASCAHAVTIDWVTVGDPGNAGGTLVYSGTAMTFGAVAQSFRIMKYEWTNSQYTEFLNAVDPQGTNPNSIWNSSMGSDPRGGISFNSGNANGSKYAVSSNMADKPVNFVSWFDAARVANWLHNGSQIYGSTDSSASAPQNTGAYTLGTATSGTAPAQNVGSMFYVPTEDQWYKAAYYKGGGTNAGYWEYATQVTGTAPTAVTANATGIGSAGSTGNFANYLFAADWNGQNGNVTTVGTNGGQSAYGTFDQTGNLYEWNDLTGAANSLRGLRGGGWQTTASNVSSAIRYQFSASGELFSFAGGGVSFRLASPVAVPEPSTWAMGLAGLACGGWQVGRRRKRATEKERRRRPAGAIC